MNAGDAPAQPVGALPLHILSVNPGGLRDTQARRTLFGLFMRGPWHVLAVQELHAASVEEAAAWLQDGAGPGQPMRGDGFVNPHSSVSGGVLTFVKEGCPIASATATTPLTPGGRLLAVQLTYAGVSLEFVNCYAPTVAADRPAFFQSRLAPCLPAAGHVLAVGDWNCVGDSLDVVGAGLTAHRTAGFAQLAAVLDSRGLVDVWRHLHPGERAYTHASAFAGSAARLDRGYASAPLLPWVKRVNILHGLPGDHLGVSIELVPPACIPSGPGRFSLPVHLLSDAAFCEATRQRIRALCVQFPVVDGGARQRWESVKTELTLSAMAHTAQVRATAQQQRRGLVRAAQRAFDRQCAQPESHALRVAYVAARQQLLEFEVAAADARATAGDVLMHCYGERNTKWFHKQGRRILPQQPLAAVLNPADHAAPPADMASPAGIQQALQHAEDFFSGANPAGLFHPAQTTPAAQESLLAAVDRVLSPDQAAATLGPAGDGQLSGEEVEGVFSALPRGVSPGLDGLPYEYYITFWEDLGPLFVAMANEALEAAIAAGGEGDWLAVLPPSMLSILIILLPKPGQADRSNLDASRPISLTNCDYRILARVLAARMALPLASVLDVTQTAFLPGRWIGDNVLFHLEEVAELQASGQSGCIAVLDFRKAYDLVVRRWIALCLQSMHFPAAAVAWVRVMLAGTVARVSLNGHYTAAFPVLSGVQQGSPLSCVLFNVTVQPMAAALRRLQQQGVMRPIMLHGTPAPPCHQHADDTTVHGERPQDIAAALNGPVGLHCQASGAELSPPKSKGIMFGDQSTIDPATRVCNVCQIPFPQDPVRHLGIFLGTDEAEAAQRTFRKVLGSVVAAAAHWRQVRLSYLGRAHVAKQVLAAIAVYHATFVPPPPALWRRITAVISAFVADSSLADGQVGGGISHPGRCIAALPWDEGGVSLVDPSLQLESLQGKVAARLLHPAHHPWKQLMAHRLQAALPALGAAAPISSLQVTGHLPLSPRHLGYLRGLQRCQPHRLAPPDTLSPDQVRVERLFYNRQIRHQGQPLVPAQHELVSAAGVFTVGQLVQALLDGAAPPQLAAALQIVWECLPAAWQQLADQPASQEWQMLHMADGSLLVRHAPAQGPVVHFEVHTDHSLHPVAAPPGGMGGDAVWHPCCVLTCLSHPSQPQRGTTRFLAGPWADLVVEPSVWGTASTSILDYTVKEASQRRIHLRAKREVPGWFELGVGCRPALWELPADVPGPAAVTTGLQAAELRWQSSHDRRLLEQQQPRHRRTAEFAIELPPCMRPGKRSRLSVHERLALRHEQQQVPPAEAQPPGVGVGQQGPHALPADDTVDTAAPTPVAEGDPSADIHKAQRAFWKRLRQADLPRDQYGLAYRIAHGALYVGAFQCHISVLPPDAAYCTHPACQLQQLETLTHAFLLCPAVVPAVSWLCNLFAAVSGQPAPPADPQVLLADSYAAWQPQPSSLQFLWTNMRLTFLHSVWQLRCRRSLTHQPFGSLAVAGAVVRALRAAMQRDWTRVSRDLTRLEPAYQEWFRGRDPSLDRQAFEQRWAYRGVLCRVAGNSLHLRLSLDGPVPAPAAGPAVAAAAAAAAAEPGVPVGQPALPGGVGIAQAAVGG